jgi:hypothetical protein
VFYALVLLKGGRFADESVGADRTVSILQELLSLGEHHTPIREFCFESVSQIVKAVRVRVIPSRDPEPLTPLCAC